MAVRSQPFEEWIDDALSFHPRSSPHPDPQLQLAGKAIPWTSSYKYLGIDIEVGGRPFSAYRKRALTRTHRAAMAISALGMYSGKLPVPIGIQMYKSLVRPLMEYAGEIGSLRPWKEADQLQRLMGRRILHCWSRTPTAAIRGELGLLSMEARYQQLKLSLWGHLHMGTNVDHHPSHLVYHASLCAFTHTTAASEVPVPSASVSEGWSVRFAHEDRIHAIDVKMKLGLSLWPAQIKRDLYQLDLESYWNNPALSASSIQPTFSTYTALS